MAFDKKSLYVLPMPLGTLCGAIYPENVLGVNRFVLSVFKDGQFTENDILATSAAAQNFIAVIAVHGGKICKPKLTANRMDIMIQNLLDANRIRAGQKIALKREECDLTVLAQSTLELLKSIHGDRFKFVSPVSCNCFIDPMGLRRVIENLCNNAVKYGSPNTPITIAIEQINFKILIIVHNEGPVISKRDQTTLFNQFQRTESAEAGGKKGWGIGLTLIRGLVEGHGGTVRVESEIDNVLFFLKWDEFCNLSV